MNSPTPIRELSPAKINLHLRVGPPGADGFHPILSWMCTVGLCDEVEFAASDTTGVHLRCDNPALPTDRSNLVLRAADALARAAKISPPPTDIVLHKNIPTGGGLGGGSSNAAMTLVALSRIWGLHWQVERLAAIGQQLGSDVPFFFHGPSSACTGRGEHVQSIPVPAATNVLLIFPALAMPTPAVYHRFDEMKLGQPAALANPPDWWKWAALPAQELLPYLVNDLETPAFDLCPQLGRLRSDLEQSLGQIVRMSGSGSTLFTLLNPGHATTLPQRPEFKSLRCGVFPLAPRLNRAPAA